MIDSQCEELGLFQPADTGATYCGRYEFDDGSWADVTCNAFPTRFWDIAVYTSDGKRLTRVETGNGDLADYWPTIELIAEGMLTAYLAPLASYIQPWSEGEE